MKKRKCIWIVMATILIVAVFTISNPQIRTNIFVRLYHEQIEEGLRINAGVPADDAVLFGYKYVNTWEGEHSMVEFLISTRGDTYYGCYYYHFVGCTTGSCVITSNPVNSMIYMGLMGWLLSGVFGRECDGGCSM